MTTTKSPDDSVEEPHFKVPFSAADQSLLEERAPHFIELLDLVDDVRDRSANHRSLGARESLAALRALEVAGRLVESLSTDLLAHYKSVGDSAAHGYRTTEGLLEGEFRITTREALRRTHLSDQLAGRVSTVGEALDPIRPVIAENFADGRISADEAKALCDAVNDLPPTVRSAYSDQVEKTLVELAPTVRLKDIPKLSQRIVQTIDPDGKLPRYETNPLAYTVTLTQQRNGDWRLRGLLNCPTGTTLQSLLYGRMKDGDVPVAIRPHSACNMETSGPSTEDPSRPPGNGGTPAAAPHATPAAPTAAPIEPGQPASADDTRAVPHDAPEYSVTSAADDTDDAIPQIPREAVWIDSHLTVHADATIEINGHTGTFLEEEPFFYLDDNGWPVYVSERVLEGLQSLHQQARDSDSGVARTVIWEKVLGRAPTAEAKHDVPECTTPDNIGPSDSAAAISDSGVFADGSRNPQWLQGAGGGSPGLARHDRLAFLLRSVARERVQHGADHALVVTAKPEDLVRPNSVLSTHSGSPLSIGQLEAWSNAAQMFVHIANGAGRTIEVRSQGRFATRSQIAVLAARDQGCTFPDCDAPAEWCEAHHIIEYSQGGETAVDNLTLVCPFHHRWFERSGWESTFFQGFPAWVPPKSVDPHQQPLFHSRFRVALLNLPPELPLTG